MFLDLIEESKRHGAREPIGTDEVRALPSFRKCADFLERYRYECDSDNMEYLARYLNFGMSGVFCRSLIEDLASLSEEALKTIDIDCHKAVGRPKRVLPISEDPNLDHCIYDVTYIVDGVEDTFTSQVVAHSPVLAKGYILKKLGGSITTIHAVRKRFVVTECTPAYRNKRGNIKEVNCKGVNPETWSPELIRTSHWISLPYHTLRSSRRNKSI